MVGSVYTINVAAKERISLLCETKVQITSRPKLLTEINIYLKYSFENDSSFHKCHLPCNNKIFNATLLDMALLI
jgi:hypothetical protein